jgi:cytochrome P450
MINGMQPRFPPAVSHTQLQTATHSSDGILWDWGGGPKHWFEQNLKNRLFPLLLLLLLILLLLLLLREYCPKSLLKMPPETLPEILPNRLSRLVLLAAVLFVFYLIIFFFRRPRLPKIPIIGSRNSDWFPLLQAQWRNTRDPKTALDDAYAHACPVIVPVAGVGNMVILPPTDIKFITEQPESMLSFRDSVYKMLQLDHTFADPTIPRVPIHENLVRTKLTAKIGSLIPDLVEEANWAFERHWGINADEWREICVFDTMCNIAGNMVNRAFVGLPFCRDPELVNNGMAFARDVPVAAALINLVWEPLRPIMAPLITIPNYIHTRKFRKILASEISRRLRNYDEHRRDPEAKSPAESEPNDFLQWSIQQAKEAGDPYMWRNATLADRILAVNFAAIHTTSFTLTDALLDLVSSKPETLDEIRDEVTSVLALHGGQWNKRALAQLEKLDSAIRESARYSAMVSLALGRVVAAKDGLVTASGVHLPRGTRISVPAYSVMHDEARYAGAETFTPFRFSDQRNSSSSHPVNGGDGAPSTDYVRRARNAFPTTSPDYLVFGYGKHSCPGRFFAAAELKLILANALLRYDFEFLPKRPESSWAGLTRIPPLKATIRVKRRTDA